MLKEFQNSSQNSSHTSWNDVDDPTSAPNEMSPFLPILHYSYESWVNDVYFGDLHRSFYNLHSLTPKKGREESSLHSIKSSLHTTAQSNSLFPLLPTTGLFLQFVIHNIQKKITMLKILPRQKTKMSCCDSSVSS